MYQYVIYQHIYIYIQFVWTRNALTVVCLWRDPPYIYIESPGEVWLGMLETGCSKCGISQAMALSRNSQGSTEKLRMGLAPISLWTWVLLWREATRAWNTALMQWLALLLPILSTQPHWKGMLPLWRCLGFREFGERIARTKMPMIGWRFKN